MPSYSRTAHLGVSEVERVYPAGDSIPSRIEIRIAGVEHRSVSLAPDGFLGFVRGPGGTRLFCLQTGEWFDVDRQGLLTRHAAKATADELSAVLIFQRAGRYLYQHELRRGELTLVDTKRRGFALVRVDSPWDNPMYRMTPEQEALLDEHMRVIKK